jgi:hypothetical protein
MRLLTLASILGSLVAGGCSGLWGDDEFGRYAQRTDRITLSAGDAKEVNAAAHMLTPWPPGVGDRRIPADGARMQRAMERYRREGRPPDPLPDIGIGGSPLGTALPTEAPTSGGGAAAGGGAPAGGGGGSRGLSPIGPLQGQ